MCDGREVWQESHLRREERKEAYVAEPVTAPGLAGLLRTVLTVNLFPPGPSGPSTST